MSYFQTIKKDFERCKWMDALRGIAIVLVVHVHVVDSVFAKYPNAPEMLRSITGVMAPLRMPILVFLSGLLVSGSIAKGRAKYFSGKLENIAYPFAVWTVIMYLIYMVREHYLGEPSPIVLSEALTISPFHHLWFLYYLFLFYIVVYPLNKAVVFTTATLGIVGYIALGEHGYARFTSLYLFFLLGACIGRSLSEFSGRIRRLNPLILIWPTSLATICFILYRASGGGSYSVYYSLSALFIAPALIRLAMWMECTWLSSFLEFLGRGSLVIYLTHVPFAMTLPVLLKKYYTGDVFFVYPILMLTTVVFCIVALYLRRNYVLPSLLFSPVGWYKVTSRLKIYLSQIK